MIIEFLIGVIGGAIGAALIHAGLARKVYNLQVDTVMLQERLLQEKNQRAALTRHRDKESLEVLSELRGVHPVTVPKNPLAKFGIAK